jgi:hypothetical protein
MRRREVALSNALRPAPAETGNRPQNDPLDRVIISIHKPVAVATRAALADERHVARTCSHCGNEFKPLRRSARFCGPTCRVAAHRRSGCNANKPARTPSNRAPASQSGSEVHSGRSEPKNASAATKLLSVTRQHDAFAIIPDAQWPGMHRVRRRDGSLTGMANLTRAKEALLRL